MSKAVPSGSITSLSSSIGEDGRGRTDRTGLRAQVRLLGGRAGRSWPCYGGARQTEAAAGGACAAPVSAVGRPGGCSSLPGRAPLPAADRCLLGVAGLRCEEGTDPCSDEAGPSASRPHWALGAGLYESPIPLVRGGDGQTGHCQGRWAQPWLSGMGCAWRTQASVELCCGGWVADSEGTVGRLRAGGSRSGSGHIFPWGLVSPLSPRDG